MPVQTTKKSNIYFPDGAKVSVKCKGDADWHDVGAINSAVTATLNWTESVVETANAGTLDTKISKMEIAGGFTLINLDTVGVAKMSGGALTLEEVTGSTPVTFDNQVLNNVVAGKWYAMELVKDGGHYNLPSTAAKPVVTSVTAESALVEDTDYVIIRDDEGFKIKFIAAAEEVTIVYGANTVVESKKLHGGSSTQVLSPYAMKIDHEDDNGKHRILHLYAVYGNSGGFQFNFKGANEDGVEEMPLTFTARLDTTLTNGKQLFTWEIEGGAQ